MADKTTSFLLLFERMYVNQGKKQTCSGPGGTWLVDARVPSDDKAKIWKAHNHSGRQYSPSDSNNTHSPEDGNAIHCHSRHDVEIQSLEHGRGTTSCEAEDSRDAMSLGTSLGVSSPRNTAIDEGSAHTTMKADGGSPMHSADGKAPDASSSSGDTSQLIHPVEPVSNLKQLFRSLLLPAVDLLAQQGVLHIYQHQLYPLVMIGHGGCAKLQLCQFDKQEVVVKTAVGADANYLLLIREAKVNAVMRRHPNIAHMTAYVTDWQLKLTGIAFDRMASDLTEFMTRHRRWHEQVVAKTLFDVCSALEVVHDMGLVHLDVKPDNILVDAKYWKHAGLAGKARLADFGLAHLHCELPKWKIGTVQYGAPEMWTKSYPTGPACDVYSIGVVAVEMLLRHQPYHKLTKKTIYSGILSGTLKITAEQLPGHWQWIVQPCLEENPILRPSMKDVRDMLEGLLLHFKGGGWS